MPQAWGRPAWPDDGPVSRMEWFRGRATRTRMAVQDRFMLADPLTPMRTTRSQMDSRLRGNDGGHAGMKEGGAGMTEGGAGMKEGARE